MFRKLKEQSVRYGMSVPTFRNYMALGLKFSQIETGTIFISDAAIEEFFGDREITKASISVDAQEMAAKVLA